MIIVFTKFPIKPEFNAQYAKHLKEAVKKHTVQEQPGFVDMKLLEPKSMPGMQENAQFIIATTWKDMESFTNYTKSDAFKKSHEDMPPREWFSGRPSVEVFETID